MESESRRRSFVSLWGCASSSSSSAHQHHQQPLLRQQRRGYSASSSSSSESVVVSKGRALANRFMMLRPESDPAPPSVPKLAATILVCQPSPRPPGSDPLRTSDYKVLMVKRSQKARFMPGAHVFPGGILEENDWSSSHWAKFVEGEGGLDPKAEGGVLLSTRVAAVRELFEETNVLLHQSSKDSSVSNAISPPPEWRDEVRKSADRFPEVYSRLGLQPPLKTLLPFSRWVTPKQERYRYDTYFYLVPLQPEEPSSASSSLLAAQDNSETTQVEWFRPEEALQAFVEGRIILPPPTWITLTELSEFGSRPELSSLCNRIRQGRDMTPREPHIKVEEDRLVIAFKGDAVHPQSLNPHPDDRNRCELVDSHKFRLISNISPSNLAHATNILNKPNPSSRL